MTFVLGTASRAKLAGVHPDLQKVVERAIQITTVDFKVIEGVRSVEQAWINWGKGRSREAVVAAGGKAAYAQPSAGKVTWVSQPLGTMHLKQRDGFGHAVDLLPAPYDWKDLAQFRAVNKAMMAAAKEVGVSIRWGRDWDRDGIEGEKGEQDGPHWELAKDHLSSLSTKA